MSAALLEETDNPFEAQISALIARVQNTVSSAFTGRVIKAVGPVAQVTLQDAKVGDLVRFGPSQTPLCFGEVVGFDKDLTMVAILGQAVGIGSQTPVCLLGNTQTVNASQELIGRVIDGMGQLADGKGPLKGPTVAQRIYANPPDPLERRLIAQPIPTGVRSIDSLLTLGEGQRVGVFAAAGVGKSTLLAQIVNGAHCDVRIVALIGERGREVREFIEHSLGAQGMEKTIIVCATSDRSALERMRAAYIATALAEFFRDQGKKVLLVMDSVTRFARALREVGLSAGEPPTRGGFPPSVFATLPRLLERSGMGKVGSITAIYTVLVEGDDFTEPIADETRSILDGHIILSRDLASANHFPAIDVLASVSRVMPLVVDAAHQQAAARLRQLLAAYKEAEILIKVGEYRQGSDPLTDEAHAKWSQVTQFLRQSTTQWEEFENTTEQLRALVT